MSIVHVVAVLTAKPGKRGELLALFNENVPNVLAEDGCIEYGATVDTPDAGKIQTPFGLDTFVVIEKWQTMAHLGAHAVAPHMVAYGASAKDLLTDRKIHILSPA